VWGLRWQEPASAFACDCIARCVVYGTEYQIYEFVHAFCNWISLSEEASVTNEYSDPSYDIIYLAFKSLPSLTTESAGWYFGVE
jgi:hypothetical protein